MKLFKLYSVNGDYTMSKVTFWTYLCTFIILSSFLSIGMYWLYLDSLSWLQLLKHFGKSLI